jgi:hypothetical protein
VLATLGLLATKETSQAKDRAWLTLSGGMCALLLLVTFFLPGTLNNYWALNVTVVEPERDQFIAVPRDDPKGDGKRLGTDDAADAATEVIRHDDLLLSVETVKAGQLPDKNRLAVGLVHLQFANIGSGPITFKGFDNDKHRPALTDTSGRAYAFLEQRQRLRSSGDPVFAPRPGGVELHATESQGYLLVFELPLGGLKTLKLELPAAAWGRQGVYQFFITGPF